MTPAERLAGGIDTFIDAVGRITAWSSFALALVMGTNVLLRYGFSTGSVWAQELEWHLMSPICLFGMSYALRHGEHVRVDVLYASFSQIATDVPPARGTFDSRLPSRTAIQRLSGEKVGLVPRRAPGNGTIAVRSA